MAPKNKENNKRKKQVEEEGDEDYRKRRDRNNQVICLSIAHMNRITVRNDACQSKMHLEVRVYRYLYMP